MVNPKTWTLVPCGKTAAAFTLWRYVCDAHLETLNKLNHKTDGRGIYGVEMFLMPDGTVLLNEIAPRPHNTGHYTIEATDCCQFENHLRAVTGMPLGSTAMKVINHS